MSEPITVVSGLPRSGTSMMMQMLVAGGMEALTDGVRTPDTDNPKGYFEFERVKGLPGDTGWLDHAQGKVVKVIHRLVTQLPADKAYRVIVMERDLDEVLLSQGKMLERLGKPGGALAAERLKAIFQQDLDRMHATLGQWPHTAVLRVPHGGLIADAAAHVHTVNTFLGGALDEARMAAVVDRALHRSKRS